MNHQMILNVSLCTVYKVTNVYISNSTQIIYPYKTYRLIFEILQIFSGSCYCCFCTKPATHTTVIWQIENFILTNVTVFNVKYYYVYIITNSPFSLIQCVFVLV